VSCGIAAVLSFFARVDAMPCRHGSITADFAAFPGTMHESLSDWRQFFWARMNKTWPTVGTIRDPVSGMTMRMDHVPLRTDFADPAWIMYAMTTPSPDRTNNLQAHLLINLLVPSLLWNIVIRRDLSITDGLLKLASWVRSADLIHWGDCREPPGSPEKRAALMKYARAAYTLHAHCKPGPDGCVTGYCGGLYATMRKGATSGGVYAAARAAAAAATLDGMSGSESPSM